MSENNDIHGVDISEEVDQKKYIRDTRTTGQKFSSFMSNDGILILSIMLSLTVCFEAFISMFQGQGFGISNIWILLIMFYLNKKSKLIYRLPFRKPESSGELDLNELHPKFNTPMESKGISFYGNDSKNKDQLWFSSDDVRVHCLIFGTTGGGKTEALLSICLNSLIQSSGFIYVDGKGDTSLFLKVFSMARRMNREDDLLIINYMMGKENLNEKSLKRLSNTMNPFSDGSADSLSELVVSLLPNGGDGMWKGRAAVFMAALLKVLVALRDERKIQLDINAVRKYFSLEKLEELIERDDILPVYKDGLMEYVYNLPGYIKKDPSKPNQEIVQDIEVFTQHSYITMQYTEVFGMLSDQYGHIMKTQLAEVDLYDVVVHRRILIVLLPVLEKSPQSISNLGKIIISSIKSMMVFGLGAGVEGSKQDMIDSKVTNSPSPYITVFDEYGYYAVEGAASMPAQARGLGFGMIFAGQDYQAFKKGSAEDAASIVANCGIKICMKLEDPTETLDIFVKAAGEAVISLSNGLQKDKDSGNYADSGQINNTTKQRITGRDLRRQGVGEGHILFKDTLVRAKLFFANPEQCDFMSVNKFLKVPMPDYNSTRRLILGYNRIKKAYKSLISEDKKDRKDSIKTLIEENNGSDLTVVLKEFKKLESVKDLQTKSLLSLYSYIKKQNTTDSELENDIDQINELSKINNDFIEDDDEYVNEDIDIDIEKGSSSYDSDIDDDYNDFDDEPIFEEEKSRDVVKGSFKDATENRKITGKDKSGSDKLRDILQKSHIKTENNHNSYNPYNKMNINVPELQQSMRDLETKLTKNYNSKGLLDDDTRLDEGYSDLATEKIITDIGLGTSYHNEVKIKKIDQNKKVLKSIIDDIILSDID